MICRFSNWEIEGKLLEEKEEEKKEGLQVGPKCLESVEIFL